MAVKIRLARRGRKGLPFYSIVVADSRAPSTGKFIEKIGTYNPNIDPSGVSINTEKALKWLQCGAKPTDTARNLLSTHGVMLKRHLQIGVDKGAITQEKADKDFESWKSYKDTKLEKKLKSAASNG